MNFKQAALAAALSLSTGFVFAAATTIDPTGSRVNTITGDDANYVVTDLEFNLSNNVGATYDQNSTAFVIGTWNPRGRNGFAGSSEGGAVKACGDATTGSTEPTAPSIALDAAGGCSGS